MSSLHTALKATYSHQNPAFQSDTNDEKPQYRRAFSYNGYNTWAEEEPQEQKAIEPPPTTHVVLPILESKVSVVHREIKSGRQRFRWNLVFNILVWIICPLPLWLPFLSNKVAIYLLPSIQCVFVFIWFIISLLAARNALILFRLVIMFFLSFLFFLFSS
jgi:hypothetical protein